MRRFIALAFVLVAAPLGGACNANIAQLDSCYELAQALCSRLTNCNVADVDKDHCATDVETQCRNVDDSAALEGAHDCADALGGSCSPALPGPCANIQAAVGCNACPSTRPTADAQAACCNINLFSAVCVGCP